MGVKYKVNSNFFKNWSRNGAYVLGYLFANGSLEDATYLRGKYLRVTSCDLAIVQAIRSTLGSEHKIVKLPPNTRNGRYRYFLRIGDHTMYKDLINLGLTPKKSATMLFPKNIPYNLMKNFIRGYFDGDGTIHLEKRKNSFIPRAVFTSGSKKFLESLSATIANHCDLRKDKKIYDSHRSFQLVYKTKEAIKVMDFMFNKLNKKDLFLERKYSTYKNYKSVFS